MNFYFALRCATLYCKYKVYVNEKNRLEYLMGISNMYRFMGFELDVNLITISGKNIFMRLISIIINAMSSLDTPASISFKCDTVSIVEKPICKKKINKYIFLWDYCYRRERKNRAFVFLKRKHVTKI